MKRLPVYLLAALLAVTGCSEDKTETPDPSPGTGVTTPVGAVDEATKAEKVIGAAGGTLSSKDGEMTVTVPAGALTADQNISIQRIANTNPMGINKGYRILPHNVQFAKEVTVTFKYSDAAIANTFPEALGVAYQDEAGVWQQVGGAIVDKTNKKIAVKTTHFSDWSFFELLSLKAASTVLGVNESTTLEVFVDANSNSPMKDNKRPIGQKTTAPSSLIKKWTLAGAGKLTGNGSKGTYKAPATVPTTQNPVAISVDVNLGVTGQFLLIANIQIADDGDIQLRIDGGAWITHKATPVTKFSEGYYAIADSDGDERNAYIWIRWEGEVGTHPYKQPIAQDGTHVHYLITGGNNYTCSYIKNDQLVASGGGVTITSMGQKGGYVEGTFDINPAGYGSPLTKTARVEGKFKVKRLW